MDTPFLAMIMAWAANFAPRDWAYCDGRQMQVSQNQALYSLIGNIYGGNGQTYFNLPDLRGRVPVGAGQMPGGSTFEIGQSGGSETTTLSQNQMPAHTHGASAGSLTVTPVYSKNNGTSQKPEEGNVPAAVVDQRGTAMMAYGPDENTENGASLNVDGAVTIDPAGGSMPLSVMQPYQVINWVIALQGIYPSRP
jgi:microcystin-dependent protein